MAEKQLAYRVSGNDEFFADDDPLAELARIVGFEQRPAAPAAQAAPRQEPAFNLEDELLQEFERYDTPSLSPADDIVLSSEDVEAHQHPHNPPAPAFEAPVAEEAPLHRAEPEFEAPKAVAEYSALEPEPEEVLGWQFEEAPEIKPAPSVAVPVVEAAAPQAETQDLADELEMSIAPVAPAAPAQRSPQWAAASIRLPLANFNTSRRVEVKVEPVVSAPEIAPAAEIAPEFKPSETLGFPAEQDRHEPEAAQAAPVDAMAELEALAPDHFFDLAAAVENELAVQADAALTEPAYAEEPAAPSNEIDDLLDDVSRYPVPDRSVAAQPAAEPVVVAPLAAAAIEAPASVRVTPPVAPAVVAAAPVRAEPPAPAPVRAEPKAAEPESDDPFAGHDFELDLEGIELELADFDFRAGNPAPAPAAPVAARPAPVTPAVAMAAAAASQFAEAVRPEMASRPAPAVVAPAVAPVAAGGRRMVEDDQPLPFDPSEISDTGERVETFEGAHVPALPHTDHEEPVAIPPEFDFDIDAEMASLFSAQAKAEAAEAAKQPTPAPAAAERPMPAAWARHAAAQTAAPAAVAKEDGLDEFERALEEDFRRSVREASGPTESATRMTLETASAVSERRRVRSMRGLAAGVAAIVVLGLGIYGVREWTSSGAGSSLGLASGQPRVITADKDPVKVVPEDPGGKVVPNQDKAVYDRVAGDAATTPKQKELVSSAEQPVDVVQKTLEAEAPDEGDNPDLQANATPVGETEDPRLLPNHDAGADTDVAAASSDDQAIPSVSPRKVRTMIVKPDGTLVAREDTAPAVDTSVKTSASPATAPTDKPTQLASAKAAAAPPSASALAAATDSDAPSAESTPIRVVKTTKTEAPKPAAAAAPVAAAPAAEKPAAAVVPEKPKAQPATQVASASPATQPVKAAPPASAGAGAYAVQIASLPSEAEAKKSQAALSAKFASVIGGHSTEVKRADIAGKGTYYRVRVVASSKDEAADICVRLRQAGGTCLISK